MYEQNMVDLPTKTLPSSFAPLMFVGPHKQFPLKTMVLFMNISLVPRVFFMDIDSARI